MSVNFSRSAVAQHRLNCEMPSPRMAKADLKKIEVGFRREIGRCVAKARKVLDLSQKELCERIEKATGEARDVAQLSRWEAGTERPQFDVLFSVEEFRQPFVIALAALEGSFEIVTELRVKRTA